MDGRKEIEHNPCELFDWRWPSGWVDVACWWTETSGKQGFLYLERVHSQLIGERIQHNNILPEHSSNASLTQERLSLTLHEMTSCWPHILMKSTSTHGTFGTWPLKSGLKSLSNQRLSFLTIWVHSILLSKYLNSINDPRVKFRFHLHSSALSWPSSDKIQWGLGPFPSSGGMHQQPRPAICQSHHKRCLNC